MLARIVERKETLPKASIEGIIKAHEGTEEDFVKLSLGKWRLTYLDGTSFDLHQGILSFRELFDDEEDPEDWAFDVFSKAAAEEEGAKALERFYDAKAARWGADKKENIDFLADLESAMAQREPVEITLIELEKVKISTAKLDLLLVRKRQRKKAESKEFVSHKRKQIASLSYSLTQAQAAQPPQKSADA
uniref:Uncharacterized protein n=1 Tax=Chromera velia CCMP2878 TaxID=1169474 RepID=A0A0G4HPD4_9ALVE|eukprot:Cvel_29789.t1-p1 / transcript=Cvel_29789.t1 / gene=Cvel_29789 / organism=Chromera_velia_CCMP2878 / gene_product=hypothetical protein / transcript_product=hypothetical protein / location=Cvel_scaffold4142:8467-9033(-) / protein_length=189 / sequence_SO=supercontig / SO=protein_coding / is_pseudo=false